MDGVTVTAGKLNLLDDFTGEYELILFLADGEIIVIDGLISLYDGILAGVYDDDFTTGGWATLYPQGWAL